MAYEVIKRVSGRAYRYRVESFRDPETRRVRGRWTYLGRVDPADAGLPERPAKASSRDRLLDAVARLLATTDPELLSAGAIAHEAGVAYGTFYRYFTGRAHAVREALLRRGPSLGNVAARFGEPPGTRASERERIASWLREIADVGRRERGVVRAWHVYSNADEAVVRARREAVDAAVDRVTAYLDALRNASVEHGVLGALRGIRAGRAGRRARPRRGARRRNRRRGRRGPRRARARPLRAGIAPRRIGRAPAVPKRRRMLARRLLLAAMAIAALAAPASADATRYRAAAPAIEAVLKAPPIPFVVVGPRRDVIAIETPLRYPPVADLARPCCASRACASIP